MKQTECLFDPKLLQELDFSNTGVFKKNGLSYKYAGENLVMRPLCMSDYHKDYVKLMGDLTSTGNVTPEMFRARFEEMRSCQGTYYIVVVENTAQSKIAASGSVIVEKYLDRNVCVKSRGRIEDIVVLESHRGKQLGKLILDTLVLLAEHTGCDELSLECKDHLIKFYNQFGFVHLKGEKYMTRRLNTTH